MAKARFPLKMANNELVKNMEELKKHFDLASVIGYYDDNSLIQWLTDRYHDDEAEKIKALDREASDFTKCLCEILGVAYSGDGVDLAEISARNERLKRLKGFTSDNEILAAVDKVAFTQEELVALLDKAKVTDYMTIINFPTIENTEIYLCGDRFEIPGLIKYVNVTLKGVNNPKPKVAILAESVTGITFQNVDFDIGYIIRQAKKSTDPVEAANLWRKAAEQGDAEAQNQLGECYYYGKGVKKDETEANKWYHKAIEQYRKAAEQGDAKAQYNLGVCYYIGIGVEQNKVVAIKWLRKAADQGDEQARDALKTSKV
jgi:hypothetical protein